MKLRGLSFGDRLFWSIMIFIGIGIVWLKVFGLQTLGLSLIVDAVLIGWFLYAARPLPEEPIDFDMYNTKGSDT